MERVAEAFRVIPGQAIDFANKLLKPVANFWTTYRRVAQGIAALLALCPRCPAHLACPAH